MDISARHRGQTPSTDDNVRPCSQIVRARNRMALFPRGSEVIFPTSEYWVPVVRVNGNMCVLPGVPRIFEALLDAFTPYLGLDPARPRPIRELVECAVPESALAPLLERLTSEGQRDNVRVGSYPRWGGGVHVSLIGTDRSVLERYVAQVVGETGGSRL